MTHNHINAKNKNKR